MPIQRCNRVGAQFHCQKKGTYQLTGIAQLGVGCPCSQRAPGELRLPQCNSPYQNNTVFLNTSKPPPLVVV